MSEAAANPLYFASRAAFYAWADAQPRGGFERIDGEVVAMAPERVAHARLKVRIWQALDLAIRRAGAPCEAFPDGITVEVDDTTDFVPDALVNCGQNVDGDLVSAPNPIVVVEVLSPGSGRTDKTRKLAGYFRVASIQHYLIFHAQKPELIHHQRNSDGSVLTRIITSGQFALTPPGITLQMEQIYGDLDRVS
jgi:Uma2 family endonuclease